MDLIVSDKRLSADCGRMLEGYDYPAILVSPNYEILATNRLYSQRFGELGEGKTHRCYEVSHGYTAPCDQSGEDCPLSAAKASGHKERVLHIHQSPRGKEHVDVEMLPILDDDGTLVCFVELLKAAPGTGEKSPDIAMIGSSPAFNRMLGRVIRVAGSDAAVLLLGESGTGKELAANAIHMSSTRSDKSMVTLECAGLSDTLFESELFGHVKGAFTGAHNSKKGLIEHADGGSLFLDEIGDVPISMQVKLLRLLETGTFRAVGSSEIKQSTFRLICATNKNLAALVRTGDFREDLFYRINVFPIRLPSLAERREDLGALAAALLKRLSPKKDYFITDSALRILNNQPFPGNIRELRNLLNRAIILSDTNLIDGPVLDECLAVERDNLSPSTADDGQGDKSEWLDLRSAEQHYLKQLMSAHNNDKQRVAKIAGISMRSLYRKLERD